jgi:ABC-type glycerol-3-phosphate transport system substrate-binding protein
LKNGMRWNIQAQTKKTESPEETEAANCVCNILNPSAEQDDLKQTKALNLIFSGAFGDSSGNNKEMKEIESRNLKIDGNTTIYYDETVGAGHRNGDAARELVKEFLEANPGATVNIIGYSAGGDEAITVTNALSDAGLGVTTLITFDPHSPSNIGADQDAYTLSDTFKGAAYNYYQTQGWGGAVAAPFVDNPFSGGLVHGATNFAMNQDGVTHNNIIDRATQLRLNGCTDENN